MLELANEKRPRRFEDYKGNESHIKYIKAVISLDRHASALYITGMPGTGKTTLAMLYPRATLCPNRAVGEYEPCGTCGVCTGEVTDNMHFYTIKEKDTSEVKEALEELIQWANSTPHTMSDRSDQRRRFIVVDELQNATPQSLAMLYEHLEFSPSTTTWILISMNPDKLNPIVREAIESRCKEINLGSLSKETISNRLLSYEGLSKEVADSIAYFSYGNMRKAWSILSMLLTTAEMEGNRPLTLEDVLEIKAGGATPQSRKDMWSSLKTGNLTSVKEIINSWLEKTGETIIADVLIDDLIEMDTSPSSLNMLSVLGQWKSSTNKPPLIAIILPFSSQVGYEETITTTDTPKTINVLPIGDSNVEAYRNVVAEQIKNITGKVLPTISPLQVYPEIYKMKSFNKVYSTVMNMSPF